jgi:hypothetical protein
LFVGIFLLGEGGGVVVSMVRRCCIGKTENTQNNILLCAANLAEDSLEDEAGLPLAPLKKDLQFNRVVRVAKLSKSL